MLIIDFDKQISIFAPGKCGSSALAYNLQNLTTNPNDFFRAQRLKFISTSAIPDNFNQLITTQKEYFHSIPIGDSYLMYRKLYSKADNFKHYVFVREPVSRTISGFETVINWFYSDAWLSYHSSDTTLEELWSIAQQSNDFDYHVGPFLHRTKNLECEYINIKSINLFLKEIYNIEAENLPSVPHWTIGINVKEAKYNEFKREDDPKLWDTIQTQMNNFRTDAANKFDSSIRNNIITQEIDLYNNLELKYDYN